MPKKDEGTAPDGEAVAAPVGQVKSKARARAAAAVEPAAKPAAEGDTASEPRAKRGSKSPAEPIAALDAAPSADGAQLIASAAESAAEDAPKGAKFAGLRARAGKALAIVKRPKVAMIGGAVLLVGLNVWMAIVVDGWKGQDAGLRADDAALGQKLADAQATNAFQKKQIALFTSQKAAADELAVSLEPVAAEHKDASDTLKDAGNDLLKCVNDRGTLIADLWNSSASAQAGFEAEVNAECTAAQAKFKAIPEGN